MVETKWHSLAVPEVFKLIKSQEQGLQKDDIAERLKIHGPNSLPEAEVPGIFSLFLSQFLSPLIFILILAAIVVLLMGETVDGLIILFVLFFNAIIGTIQEGKAQNTLKALKHFIEGSATVLRDNKIVIITDSGVVPGDILILQEGEKVPADARLLMTHSLKVDEASLTGESLPVEKNAIDEFPADTQISDRKNMVWKGTNIASGDAHAVVVATGIHTEIGKISTAISSIYEDVPLRKNIANLSRLIIFMVGIIGVLVFFLGVAREESMRQMFATVISMAVSIIPEGLPIVMTLVLASGVWRMTHKNVLVKKLQAVEALGQVHIIAVDKTGTLTKNEMKVETVYVDTKIYSVGGGGYEPTGTVSYEGATVEPLNHPDLLMAGRVAHYSAMAKAVYNEESKRWKVSGDPTEAAMRVFAQKVGFTTDGTEDPNIFEIPFSYVTKYHLSIHTSDGKNFLSVSGAPEKVLALCDRIWRTQKSEKLSRKEREEIEEVFLQMSRGGYRVIALAMNADSASVVTGEELPSLTFVGFFGLRDPLRTEVHEAVEKANSAGIKVIMITGDHTITASAIGKEAGILKEHGTVITGEEIEKLTDTELMKKFDTVHIFARVTPMHKMKIIELFKKKGQIIAMTGDGVNDAPSLAAADLGIAMGNIGTEVAKEAADIILLDDNFGNIISAVEEGRSIYKTIKKVVLYLFSTSVGEVLAITGSILLGFPLIVLPAQIIWLNFVTDGFLDISLAMEPKEDGLLKHRIKHSKYILDWFSVKRMLYMGTIIALGSLFIFSVYLKLDPTKALTVSMTTLAVFQWFNAWNCKSEKKSLLTINSFKNVYLIGATSIVVTLQLLAVYTPFLQKILHTVPLDLSDWIFILSVSMSILGLEELRKFFGRRSSIKINKPLEVG